jgi:hypothetical protein
MLGAERPKAGLYRLNFGGEREGFEPSKGF